MSNSPGRSRALRLLASLALFAVASCGSAGSPDSQPDPSIEREFSAKERDLAEQRARDGRTDYLLKRFDDALIAYTRNLQLGSGDDVLKKTESLRLLLEQESQRFRTQLLQLLQDKEPRPRWIAAAALGFSGNASNMEALVTKLQDPHPRVRESAALGLGELAVPYTPLDALEARLFDPKEDLAVRQGAARALLKLQEARAPAEPLEKIWKRALEGDVLRNDRILVIHALVGLGKMRKPELAPHILPYLEHPRALVRQAALLGLGRCGRREDAAAILPFLTPEESVPNVRLTARKALKALTDNKVDHGYDIGAWRAEFRLLEQDGERE